MKLIFTFLFLVVEIAFAQSQTIDLNDPGSSQTQELNLQQRQGDSYFNTAKRVRPFSLNPQITDHQSIAIGRQITLSLFDDIIHTAMVVRKVTDINGVTTLSLKLDNYQYAHAYIAISSGSYLVTVDLPESHQKYSTQSSIYQSQHFMVQLDEATLENMSCGLDDDINAMGTGVSPLPNEPIEHQRDISLPGVCIDMPDSSDPANITLMIVYTAAAQAWSDLYNNGIANSIGVTLAMANQVSVNNNLGINFLLTYSGLVDHTEQSMNADINILGGDEVIDLRRDYGADLVALLNYSPSYATTGLAVVLRSKYGNNRAAFSATQVNFAVYSYTFIHEIGHNMGARHNPYQATQPGPNNWQNWPENTWSAGWRWLGSDNNYYADLMSYGNGSQYENGQPTLNIPYFSDPNFTHLGSPAGDPVEGDNARTLREIKHYVARYKETIDYCNAGIGGSLTTLYINDVNMGDIYNSASGGSSSRYGDFTALATCMFPGDTQTLDISVINSDSSTPLKVWIDWNDDKIFDPVTELVFDSVTGSDNHSIPVTAPLGISYGSKRMRIRTYSNLIAPVVDTPCGYSGIGEVEDYTIMIEDSNLGFESFSFKDFVMFPNPVNDIFYIGTNDIEQEQVQITVVNMIGQKIYSKYMTVPSGGQLAVDISGVATGMYLVELLHPQGGKFSAKLIKK